MSAFKAYEEALRDRVKAIDIKGSKIIIGHGNVGKDKSKCLQVEIRGCN
jgi:hypothetical protein